MVWYFRTISNSEQKLASVEKFTGELGIDIASGKHGFLCQYKKELRFDTLWSVSYSINNLSIKRAEGNPKRAKFKEDKRLQKQV
ncbi:hypothetical protein [Vallitalea maricola]|uniref:Uncharacterized protein n=1 Tax=Vallitalea maricola TaxID=3074433 RepID=A0ACB5UJL2_9FIRM|nr:hypothetical protein AN2V17_13290 [Vallitalea sp. AN17-2]